tara:strand:+ start:144 stop:326 length:183 start_codon:yes stop_codon:yes gene_type:complete
MGKIWNDITTEQEVLNMVYPGNDTKDIQDFINYIISEGISETKIKNILKDTFPNITDWSF